MSWTALFRRRDSVFWYWTCWWSLLLFEAPSNLLLSKLALALSIFVSLNFLNSYSAKWKLFDLMTNSCFLGIVTNGPGFIFDNWLTPGDMGDLVRWDYLDKPIGVWAPCVTWFLPKLLRVSISDLAINTLLSSSGTSFTGSAILDAFVKFIWIATLSEGSRCFKS